MSAANRKTLSAESKESELITPAQAKEIVLKKVTVEIQKAFLRGQYQSLSDVLDMKSLPLHVRSKLKDNQMRILKYFQSKYGESSVISEELKQMLEFIGD